MKIIATILLTIINEGPTIGICKLEMHALTNKYITCTTLMVFVIVSASVFKPNFIKRLMSTKFRWGKSVVCCYTANRWPTLPSYDSQSTRANGNRTYLYELVGILNLTRTVVVLWHTHTCIVCWVLYVL